MGDDFNPEDYDLSDDWAYDNNYFEGVDGLEEFEEDLSDLTPDDEDLEGIADKDPSEWEWSDEEEESEKENER